MIKNVIANKFLETLISFSSTDKFEFVLTGSRYFGNFGDYSDWDFMVADAPELDAYMKLLGFCVVHNTSYNHDVDIVKVYEYKAACANISFHIQVIRPDRFQLRQEVQQYMKEKFPLQVFRDKTIMSRLWETITDLYSATKEVSEIRKKNS